MSNDKIDRESLSYEGQKEYDAMQSRNAEIAEGLRKPVGRKIRLFTPKTIQAQAARIVELEKQMAEMQQIIDAFPYQVNNKGDWTK